uniref:NADH-ubiquinone oxidoreductase chain 4L n=1 Tax=Coleoptera sp. 9 KM-2017 TaxID=2219343 RepID=A0A346RGG4_9COLE|nr:NADH dehydrogenase subunit 4L [Coleoptera sp. 9 KM-2017]
MLMYLYSFMYISGLVSFSLKRKHLLLMLLSLEFIVLSLYINMFTYMMMNCYDFFFIMIFLTFCVCEGALGLSMLISMVRVHGNDYIMTLSSLW